VAKHIQGVRLRKPRRGSRTAFRERFSSLFSPFLAGTGPAIAVELSRVAAVLLATRHETPEGKMARYGLLWLLGVPIPILLLIYLFGGLH